MALTEVFSKLRRIRKFGPVTVRKLQKDLRTKCKDQYQRALQKTFKHPDTDPDHIIKPEDEEHRTKCAVCYNFIYAVENEISRETASDLAKEVNEPEGPFTTENPKVQLQLAPEGSFPAKRTQVQLQLPGRDQLVSPDRTPSPILGKRSRDSYQHNESQDSVSEKRHPTPVSSKFLSGIQTQQPSLSRSGSGSPVRREQQAAQLKTTPSPPSSPPQEKESVLPPSTPTPTPYRASPQSPTGPQRVIAHPIRRFRVPSSFSESSPEPSPRTFRAPSYSPESSPPEPSPQPSRQASQPPCTPPRAYHVPGAYIPTNLGNAEADSIQLVQLEHNLAPAAASADPAARMQFLDEAIRLGIVEVIMNALRALNNFVQTRVLRRDYAPVDRNGQDIAPQQEEEQERQAPRRRRLNETEHDEQYGDPMDVDSTPHRHVASDLDQDGTANGSRPARDEGEHHGQEAYPAQDTQFTPMDIDKPPQQHIASGSHQGVPAHNARLAYNEEQQHGQEVQSVQGSHSTPKGSSHSAIAEQPQLQQDELIWMQQTEETQLQPHEHTQSHTVEQMMAGSAEDIRAEFRKYNLPTIGDEQSRHVAQYQTTDLGRPSSSGSSTRISRPTSSGSSSKSIKVSKTEQLKAKFSFRPKKEQETKSVHNNTFLKNLNIQNMPKLAPKWSSIQDFFDHDDEICIPGMAGVKLPINPDKQRELDELEAERERKEQQEKEAAAREAARKAAEEEAAKRRAEVAQLGTQGLRKARAKLITPLNAEWSKKVEDSTKGSDKYKSAGPDFLDLSAHDFRRLAIDGQWLNDNIVCSVLLNLAAERNDGINIQKQSPKMVALDSHWIDALEKYGWTERKSRGLKRSWGMTPENFEQVELVAIPVNVDGNHWTTIHIRPNQKKIAYIDSFRQPGKSYIEAIRGKWLPAFLGNNYNSDEWETVHYETPKQIDGYNCGVHVITNTMFLALGLDPNEYSQQDLFLQRRRLTAMLMNGGFKGDFSLSHL